MTQPRHISEIIDEIMQEALKGQIEMPIEGTHADREDVFEPNPAPTPAQGIKKARIATRGNLATKGE